MVQDVQFVQTGESPGRALHISANGTLYVSRNYRIFRSSDGGTTWELDCYIPVNSWRGVVGTSRLGARLLRQYVAAFEVLPDGTRIAIAQDGIYRASAGEIRLKRVFQVTRGSRPLNFSVDPQGRIVFGEYGDGLDREAINIFVSDDGGQTFHVGYTLAQASTGHVHNVLSDENGFWVLTGDYGLHPGIGFLSTDFRNFEWVAKGEQKARAVSAIIQRDALVYGMDASREPNFINRLEKKSGRIFTVQPVEGTSLFATRIGTTALIATCVEQNPCCPSRESVLYASRDCETWQRLVSFEKDGYHPILFQFGTIVLPYSRSTGTRGMLAGQSLARIDGKVITFELATSVSAVSASAQCQ